MEDGKRPCSRGRDGGSVAGPEACAKQCYDSADCAAWAFYTENGNCWLRKTVAVCIKSSQDYIWGTKPCAGRHKTQEFRVIWRQKNMFF